MSVLRNRRFWLICLSGWLLLAGLEGVANHLDALRSGRASELLPLLAERLIADSIWVPLCAVIYLLMSRAVQQGLTTQRIVWRFAAAGLLLLPLYTATHAVAYVFMRSGDFATVPERFTRIAATTFIWDGVIFGIACLACYTVLLTRRAQQQEREQAELRTRLARAELELLRAQLEPHFLFNALNTAASLIRAGQPELATTALARLSELLRYVIEASQQPRVPLDWELQFVRNYLDLQQLRYGSRLAFAIHQPPSAASCDIPPLLLQPLIENAVVHGAACSSEPTRVDVRIGLDEHSLSVEVDNTWHADAAANEGTTRVGLRNTRQRLERLFGDAFRLEAGPHDALRYRVRVSLPRVSLSRVA